MWWLQPGWNEALCLRCGKKIWPEGDPDWGYCVECFQEQLDEEKRLRYLEDLRLLEQEEDYKRWVQENSK